MRDNPGSLATPAGQQMQVARDDAERAPGRRDGAVLPLAVDLPGVRKSFGSVQAVRGVALAIVSGEVMAAPSQWHRSPDQKDLPPSATCPAARLRPRS